MAYSDCVDSEAVESDSPSRKVLQEIVEMENSDYSAKPYIVNLDAVGPLTVYVQVDVVLETLHILKLKIILVCFRENLRS